MKTLTIIVVVIVSLLVGGYVLATAGAKSQIGYAEVVLPHIPELNKSFSLNIGPLGVLPIKWAIGFSEEKELDFLKHVDGIKIQIFEMNGEVDAVYEKLKAPITALRSDGWETTVSVNEDDERVTILTRIENDMIRGVYVFVVNSREAVFINVMGDLKAEDVSKVMAYRP